MHWHNEMQRKEFMNKWTHCLQCHPPAIQFQSEENLDTLIYLCLVAPCAAQNTCLYPAPSCAAASIFLQLYLKPAVNISFFRPLFQVFVGRPLLVRNSYSVHCSACLAMLSSLLFSVYLSYFHLLFLSWSSTGSCSVFSIKVKVKVWHLYSEIHHLWSAHNPLLAISWPVSVYNLL